MSKDSIWWGIFKKLGNQTKPNFSPTYVYDVPFWNLKRCLLGHCLSTGQRSRLRGEGLEPLALAWPETTEGGRVGPKGTRRVQAHLMAQRDSTAEARMAFGGCAAKVRELLKVPPDRRHHSDPSLGGSFVGRHLSLYVFWKNPLTF